MGNSDRPAYERVDAGQMPNGRDAGSLNSSLNNYIPGYTNVPIQLPDQPTDPNNSTPIDSRHPLARAYVGLQDSVVRIESSHPSVINGRVEDQTIAGSGFFVESDGTIATDYHVIQGSTKFKIMTASGRQYSAHLDVVDPSHDLALLRIDNAQPNAYFPALQLGSSYDVSQGSSVLAAGFPRGWQTMFLSPGNFEGAKPLGAIVGDLKGGLLPGESAQRPLLSNRIHVDEGNSGGPLLNDRGQVVGVVDISNQKNDAQATPVEEITNLLAQSRQLRNRIYNSNAYAMDLGQNIPTANLAGSLQTITDLRQRFSQNLGFTAMDLAPQQNSRIWTTARQDSGMPSGMNQNIQSIDSMRERMLSHMLGR